MSEKPNQEQYERDLEQNLKEASRVIQASFRQAAKDEAQRVLGLLAGIGIQVGFLEEVLPDKGKVRRIYNHLSATLELLEVAVAKGAGIDLEMEDDEDE